MAPEESDAKNTHSCLLKILLWFKMIKNRHKYSTKKQHSELYILSLSLTSYLTFLHSFFCIIAFCWLGWISGV